MDMSVARVFGKVVYGCKLGGHPFRLLAAIDPESLPRLRLKSTNGVHAFLYVVVRNSFRRFCHITAYVLCHFVLFLPRR